VGIKEVRTTQGAKTPFPRIRWGLSAFLLFFCPTLPD
jgi:hypothetical protein